VSVTIDITGGKTLVWSFGRSLNRLPFFSLRILVRYYKVIYTLTRGQQYFLLSTFHYLRFRVTLAIHVRRSGNLAYFNSFPRRTILILRLKPVHIGKSGGNDVS
jgi:hypothetical protein